MDPYWLEIARSEQGVHEYADGDHPRIIEYLQTVDTAAIGELTDEVSWCSAFVNWVVEQVGYRGTDSAAARSWLHWGRAISWPKIGAIVVLRRGTQSWQGHVGFVVGVDHGLLLVLGGNQKNSVNISPYTLDRVLAYRWPVEPATTSRIDMLPVLPMPISGPRKWWQFWR